MADNIPPDDNDPFDFNFEFGEGSDDGDHRDSMGDEAKELQKIIKKLARKIKDPSCAETITNNDLLQYMRIINFNFASLARLIQQQYFRQGIIEDVLLELSAEIKSFTSTNDLLEESLRVDETDSDNPEEPF